MAEVYEYQCNATFPADADLDGVGVLSSFMAMALLTMATAITSAYTPTVSFSLQLASWWRGEPIPTPHNREGPFARYGRAWWHCAANNLLVPLCDIQLVTGLGTTIAEAAQIPGITMYHLNIVNNYWLLTFDALWAAQSSGFEKRIYTEHTPWAAATQAIRSMAICCSVTLGLYIETVALLAPWNPELSGRCFRYNDFCNFQSQWLWYGGRCLYLLAVLARFVATLFSSPGNRLAWEDHVDGCVVRVERKLIRMAWAAPLTTRDYLQQLCHGPCSMAAVYLLLGVLKAMALAVLVVVCWSLRQWLAAWAIGAGTPAITTLLNLGYTAWSMNDILAGRGLNRSLIINTDVGSPWKFGQILPLILAMAIIFNLLDACQRADDARAGIAEVELEDTPRCSCASCTSSASSVQRPTAICLET